MTRMVYFVPVPEEIKGRMQKTQKIFAAMQNLMKDGMGYQAYFRKAQELYAKEGCPEDGRCTIRADRPDMAAGNLQ